MKIDKTYYETYECRGKKWYSFELITATIGAYKSQGYEVWFEMHTGEEIGYIVESENRTSWKKYYNAGCLYGWDGKKETRKEFYKALCTRADYTTACAMLTREYNNRK